MTRRDIIQQIVIGGVPLILMAPVLTACSKNDTPGGNPVVTDLTIDLNDTTYSSLKNAGGWVVKQNIIIINLGNDNFTALSSVCTHQGCEVGYDASAGNIKCPCHGSVYATTGTVINGPAPRALRSYNISKEGDILTIKL